MLHPFHVKPGARARHLGRLLLCIAPALLMPALSLTRTPGATPDPADPRGAIAIPNHNEPAEPWRAEWTGQLATASATRR